MFDTNILSLSIWVPILAGIAVLFTGDDRRAHIARPLALVGAIASFLVTLPLYFRFDKKDGDFQFQEGYNWIPSFNIHYHLGVDGIAVPLILLTSFITVIVVLSSWEVIKTRVAQYMAAFLIMSGSASAGVPSSRMHTVINKRSSETMLTLTL